MTIQKKPPTSVKGCEYCSYRKSDFSPDEADKSIIRCYCAARHVKVDAESMTKHCDFFNLNVEHAKSKENDKSNTGI